MEQYDEPSKYNGSSLSLIISGHFHVDDSYATSRPNGMEDWLITYTLSGSGYFETPDGTHECSIGDVVLLCPGTPHTYGTVKGENWNFIWTHFDARAIGDKLLPIEPLYVHTLEPGSVQTRVYEAFQRILSDSRERSEYWHDLCLNSLREILLLLAHRRNRKLDPRIVETLHYLSVHMRSPVQIETLAKSIGLSPSRLSHLFKDQMGLTIIDTLNQMRIHQACLLLEHTNRSASEIAYEVGFHNYNHFINQFRKWTGTVPSGFMKNK
jgi:AraC family transcriptional regulator of arabinose operon